MTTIQDMFAAVDAAAQDHFEWCTAHDYENEIDPEVQLCRSVLAVDVTSEDRDDVSAISVQLTGSHADEAYGFPIPQAAIALNGRPADFEMAPWKLVPTAYMLLAAHARAEGDEDRARAFLDAANVAITEHHEVEIEAERVREAGLHLDGSLFDGPFNYVMVGHPDGGVITYDQYEVEQSLAAGIPQWVVQHAEDGLRYQVVGALDSEPVDGETYSEFADAKTVRDRLNGRARAEATARQFAAYDIDDEVTPKTGPFAGQVGIVDELDFADDDTPFRVRFEHVDGEPIAWFNANQLAPAGGAR